MMRSNSEKFEDYFSHLQQISFLGRVYKNYISSPVLLKCAHQFGGTVLEVGSGVGSGVLGKSPKNVIGLDINPLAVEYCISQGLNAQVINDDTFPILDGKVDCCVLDNVLEHISDPEKVVNECYRVTNDNGGLVIAVPGRRGFLSDPDHETFYGVDELTQLDERWTLVRLFSIPFFFKSKLLSSMMRQYCLVAIYKKVKAV